ncbi:MAG: hypothetical protein AAGJ31_13160 [Verrucomicrobiota bacterium]
MRWIFPFLLILCLGVFPGCSWVTRMAEDEDGTFWSSLTDRIPLGIPGKGRSERKNAEEENEAGVEVLGAVRYTHDDHVLIYSMNDKLLEAGMRVSILGKDGRVKDVELRVRDIRKGGFVVADLVSGEPDSGDLVIPFEEESP